MAIYYPIHFTSQLRQHLRALRKKRGLTQAQAGALVGVSQARIAEIEANPGLVNLDQMMQLLSALGVTVSLREGPSMLGWAEVGIKEVEALNESEKKRAALKSNDGAEQLRKALEALNESEKKRAALKSNDGAEQLRKAFEDMKKSTALRNLLVHSKKGSW